VNGGDRIGVTWREASGRFKVGGVSSVPRGKGTKLNIEGLVGEMRGLGGGFVV
jgi:hypothetical protein